MTARSPAPVVMLLLLLATMASSSFVGARAVVEPEEAIGMPNCDITCGDLKVPYPFGMGPSRCYWPGFKLTCDHRTGKHPRLLLANNGNNGTLQQQQLQVQELYLTYPFLLVTRSPAAGGTIDGMHFKLWSGKNQLTLTGCNVRATLKNGNATMASCSSVCETYETTTAPYALTRDSLPMPCSGTHCCQADIIVNRQHRRRRLLRRQQLGYLTSYHVELTCLSWNRRSDEARVPTRVFLADKGWFEHVWLASNETTTATAEDHYQVPIWLQWEVVGDGVEPAYRRNTTAYRCPEEAAARVCKSKHSACRKGTIGYTCSCHEGFQGNPYVTHGCKDRCYYRDLNDSANNCTCPLGAQGNPYRPDGCTGLVTRGCQHSCGNVSVPYPFGVGQGHGCYREGFNLTCNDTGHEPPRLFLDKKMAMQVLEISIQNNTARVLDTRVSANGIWRPTDGTSTNTTTGGDKENFFTFNMDQEMMPYSLSTRNESILTGCNLMAELSRASDGSILSVCASSCSSSSKKQQQCNGMGCCRSCISTYNKSNMPSQFICKWKWFNKGHGDDDESPPAYAFIAEEGWFNQGRVEEEGWWFHQDQGPDKDSKLLLQVPILLQWEVFSSSAAAHDIIKSCSRSDCHCPREVSASLCKSKHSYCKRGSRGYDSEADANPYVSGGFRGRNNFATAGKYITIVVAIGAGVILSLFTASSVSKKLKHRRAQILKRQFFENNRGQLLRHLVSQRADIAERMIITLEEIEKATNNFDKARELGGGGHGTVYKGILSDLHVAAIKKPKMVVQKEIDEFINEVAILSQINHRNVVKLYGCCLETQVPLLVYEFISNGTLYEHLHTGESRSLSWDDRLRIAVETAKSLAYLHSTASVPIIHRDIKSVNILLDDTLTAKVADFGASRYVPVDRSAVTTMVQGTIGYLDPMYFYTQRLTEKSDVYSFRIVLVELLTRKKPFSYMSPEDDGLVAHFATLFAEGNLLQILDPQVVDEGGKELEAVATLAVTCVKLSGEDRPVMRQVELTLEAIRASNQGVSANSG